MNVIREWRKQNGLTQGDCARRVGVDQTTWSTWENGTQPQIHYAIAIAELTEGAVPVTAWARKKRGKR